MRIPSTLDIEHQIRTSLFLGNSPEEYWHRFGFCGIPATRAIERNQVSVAVMSKVRQRTDIRSIGYLGCTSRPPDGDEADDADIDADIDDSTRVPESIGSCTSSNYLGRGTVGITCRAQIRCFWQARSCTAVTSFGCANCPIPSSDFNSLCLRSHRNRDKSCASVCERVTTLFHRRVEIAPFTRYEFLTSASEQAYVFIGAFTISLHNASMTT